MPYTILQDERIKVDIILALDYYDAVSPTLGIYFEKELFYAFDQLEIRPHNYFNINATCRRVNLRNFPYMLVYFIKESTQQVYVVGLFHHHQSAERIQQRLK